MISIDLRSNAWKAIGTLDGFVAQVPYASMLTINETMVDVQNYLRRITYPRAWTNRNQQLPKALTVFRNADRATKTRLRAKMGPAMGRNGYMAGSGFTGRQRSGQQRTAKNKMIAIPQEKPGLRRLKSGAIPKSKRPRNNPKLFKIEGRRGNELLVERQRKKLVTRYVLTPRAKGTKRLSAFESDVDLVVRRMLPMRWSLAVNRAFRTARK